jgi:hypothetical protein
VGFAYLPFVEFLRRTTLSVVRLAPTHVAARTDWPGSDRTDLKGCRLLSPMSGYGVAHPPRAHSSVKSPISVPWVILSAALIGLGLWLDAYWLLTFNWLFFTGFPICVLGGLMLFSRRAGYDTA